MFFCLSFDPISDFASVLFAQRFGTSFARLGRPRFRGFEFRRLFLLVGGHVFQCARTPIPPARTAEPFSQPGLPSGERRGLLRRCGLTGDRGTPLHTFVEETNLTRNIFALRKALGDNERNHCLCAFYGVLRMSFVHESSGGRAGRRLHRSTLRGRGAGCLAW